jgi:hypothetical protein
MASKLRLSHERYNELLAAERVYTDLLPEFDKLDQCGEDCQMERELTSQKLAQISKLKQFYAPDAR